MAIKPLLKMGDPRLLQPSVAITEFGTSALRALLTDLCDTMQAHQGAGIAAPQIGVNLQMVIFGGGRTPRYPDADLIPFTVLLNPVLTPLSEETQMGWEGCLSVPGLRGKVSRYNSLRYQGYDIDGQVIDRSVTGFHARVVQHEVDHLHGILYPMRITDFSQFGFIDALAVGEQLVDDD